MHVAGTTAYLHPFDKITFIRIGLYCNQISLYHLFLEYTFLNTFKNTVVSLSLDFFAQPIRIYIYIYTQHIQKWDQVHRL